MKAILSVALYLIISSAVITDEYRSEVYNAYVNNKMDQWKHVIDKMEAIKERTNEMTLELVNYQYGYIGYCLDFNKEDEAKKYFSLASKNVEILDKSAYKESILNAYKAAFYGIRISFNKLSAPVNGAKSMDHIKLAIEQDKENYLAYIQYGNARLNMPAAFGGSKKEALEHFLKARKILERNPAEIKGNWNYLNLMILIAKTYEALDDYKMARITYEYILYIEPGFIYVRDVLYPGLLKKINK